MAKDDRAIGHLTHRARARLRRRERTEAVLASQQAAEPQPGLASRYIHALDIYHAQHPDMRAVIIYTRVSSDGQERNLQTQVEVLRREMKKRGLRVRVVIRETGSGKRLNENRKGLMMAVQHALKRPGTPVVATATNRYLRNVDWTPYAAHLTPTEAEFEQLSDITCGVPLLTLLDPDMPEDEVTAERVKCGQALKGNRGGRPRVKKPGSKKEHRQVWQPVVLKMHREGAKVCEIAAATPVARSTIDRWIGGNLGDTGRNRFTATTRQPDDDRSAAGPQPGAVLPSEPDTGNL